MYVVGIDTKRLLFDRALRQEFSWVEGYLFQPYVGRAGDRNDWRRLVVRYYRLSGFLEGFLSYQDLHTWSYDVMYVGRYTRTVSAYTSF
jgi:hypothetical protein